VVSLDLVGAKTWRNAGCYFRDPLRRNVENKPSPGEDKKEGKDFTQVRMKRKSGEKTGRSCQEKGKVGAKGPNTKTEGILGGE